MSLAATLRHRRAARHAADADRTRAELLGAARGFREQAQRQLDAGHPDLAVPYLDEAELFESAAGRA